MDRATDADRADNTGWTKTAVLVVRLVFLAFLLWALISANDLSKTPVAEDAAPQKSDSRAVAEPDSDAPSELG